MTSLLVFLFFIYNLNDLLPNNLLSFCCCCPLRLVTYASHLLCRSKLKNDVKNWIDLLWVIKLKSEILKNFLNILIKEISKRTLIFSWNKHIFMNIFIETTPNWLLVLILLRRAVVVRCPFNRYERSFHLADRCKPPVDHIKNFVVAYLVETYPVLRIWYKNLL